MNKPRSHTTVVLFSKESDGWIQGYRLKTLHSLGLVQKPKFRNEQPLESLVKISLRSFAVHSSITQTFRSLGST